MKLRRIIARWTLGLGVTLAFCGIASDGQAAYGTVTVWFDDITNTVGPISICETVSNDRNGDGNGNNGNSTVSNDQNGDGNGNNGKGGRKVCLFSGGGDGDSGGDSDGDGDSGGKGKGRKK